jgi:hypothetical protein
MPMNTSVASTVSELSKARPPADSSNKPRLRTAIRNTVAKAGSWLGRLVSFAFARVLLIFLIGFAAGMAWQSHGSAARKTIAGWSPRLAWMAPADAPATSPGRTSSDRLKAASLALATVRQSIDKLSAEMSKLQPEDGAAPRRRR